VALVGLLAAAGPAFAQCPNAAAAVVPGAERQEQACLGDLTTAGTQLSGHTDRSDWEGLHASGTENPSGIPGLLHGRLKFITRFSGNRVVAPGSARTVRVRVSH
jgi:hypothetical protein